MKIAIDSYCYHRYYGEVYPNQVPPTRTMTTEDFLWRAIELQVDGVSLETCFLGGFEETYLRRLREIIDQGKLEVVVAWGHPQGFAGGRKPEALADLRAMFPVCHALGAGVMRVVGSCGDYRHEPHGPQLQKLTLLFKEAAQAAADEGLRLAMENHADFNAAEMLQLVESVGSDAFGVTFDAGNALRVGDEPVAAARLLAPHIYATHTKDVAPLYGGDPQEWCFYASNPVGQGVVNIPGVVEALTAAGYSGLYAIELDYLDPKYGDEDGAVAESVRYLRALRAHRQE